MIVIGCASTDERLFRRCAAATIEAIDEGHSLLLRRHRFDSIDVPYNEMLSLASEREDLEAVVLVHEATILDRPLDIPRSVRAALSAGDVAIVATAAGHMEPSLSAVDATLVALSPWAVSNLRFSAEFGDCADACVQDLALQARRAGKRVELVAPVLSRAVPRGGRLERKRELDAWAALRRKWSPHLSSA